MSCVCVCVCVCFLLQWWQWDVFCVRVCVCVFWLTLTSVCRMNTLQGRPYGERDSRQIPRCHHTQSVWCEDREQITSKTPLHPPSSPPRGITETWEFMNVEVCQRLNQWHPTCGTRTPQGAPRWIRQVKGWLKGFYLQLMRWNNLKCFRLFTAYFHTVSMTCQKKRLCETLWMFVCGLIVTCEGFTAQRRFTHR